MEQRAFSPQSCLRRTATRPCWTYCLIKPARKASCRSSCFRPWRQCGTKKRMSRMIRKIRCMRLGLGYLIEVSERGVTYHPSLITTNPKGRCASRYYFTFLSPGAVVRCQREIHSSEHPSKDGYMLLLRESFLPVLSLGGGARNRNQHQVECLDPGEDTKECRLVG